MPEGIEQTMTEPDVVLPRQLAEHYLDQRIALSPLTASELGVPGFEDALDDFSSVGLAAQADLARSVLRQAQRWDLKNVDTSERLCARLLVERVRSELAMIDTGEAARHVSPLFSPLHRVRDALVQMPTDTSEQLEAIVARLAGVPQAYAGYRECLTRAAADGSVAGPRVSESVADQLRQWHQGSGWFTDFAERTMSLASPSVPVPEALAVRASTAGRAATAAVAEFEAWLRRDYLPITLVAGQDAVGPERYAVTSRYFLGTDIDPAEAYAWAWDQLAEIHAELRLEAQRVLPGASVRAAMDHLDDHGEVIEGVPQIREYLQALMDQAVTDLNGTHFDIAEPLQRVEAMIAPAGGAAAPYYTAPSLDFTRPGRTWLPTLGATRFPTWDLISTWFHEGVPGHHLQLGQWLCVSQQLTRFQTTLGSVSANLEGWALYAERLMDELGYLRTPAARLGYLEAQQLRIVRVIIDLGMHLELTIPEQQGLTEPYRPGERWTPELAREFFGLNSGRPAEFGDSEIVRYLAWPGQAIGYKVGERVWLAGREAARAARSARGEQFDLKAWHMAALSQGSLGLADLADELGAL